MPVSFAAKWKEVKIDYEAATDKKKPSEKFLGLFKKSSGLEPLFTAIDAALKKSDIETAQKTWAKLEKTSEAYQKTLFKAATAETDKEIQKDTKIMMAKLEDLIQDSEMAWKAAAKIPQITNLRDYAKLMKTPTADRIEAHAKARYMEDQIKFLNAMIKKDFSAKTYKDFLKDNDVNLSSSLIKQFKEDDLKSGPWDEAIDEVLRLFQTNVVKELNSKVT